MKMRNLPLDIKPVSIKMAVVAIFIAMIFITNTSSVFATGQENARAMLEIAKAV